MFRMQIDWRKHGCAVRTVLEGTTRRRHDTVNPRRKVKILPTITRGKIVPDFSLTSDWAVASRLFRAALRAPSAILSFVASECRPPTFQGTLPLLAAEILARLTFVCGLPPAAVKITVAFSPSTESSAPSAASPAGKDDVASADEFTATPPTACVGCNETFRTILVGIDRPPPWKLPRCSCKRWCPPSELRSPPGTEGVPPILLLVPPTAAAKSCRESCCR